MSIVADASLSLELSAALVPDADLYGQDLGRRREALLRSWDRLHELRSAPPGKAPSPRALRLEVEAEAFTALAVALTRGANTSEPAGTPADPNQPRTRGSRSGVSVVSRVNRDDLPALAGTVRDLAPDIWRLYQYSRRGDQNVGQQRHWLADDEFQRLVTVRHSQARTGRPEVVTPNASGAGR